MALSKTIYSLIDLGRKMGHGGVRSTIAITVVVAPVAFFAAPAGAMGSSSTTLTTPSNSYSIPLTISSNDSSLFSQIGSNNNLLSLTRSDAIDPYSALDYSIFNDTLNFNSSVLTSIFIANPNYVLYVSVSACTTSSA